MSETHRQVVLARYPEGVPVEGDFEIVEAAAPPLAEGEVRYRTEFLSLDPYMRSQIAGRHLSGAVGPGDVMRGESVGIVTESRHPAFTPGQRVRGMGGWREVATVPGDALAKVRADLEPPSYALSLLGMTGLTAWAGMVWQAKVGEGDRVLIPAVTGGVGAAAAQFCRLKGATVVGIAGSAEKCRFAVEELGCEACIDRKAEDVGERLGELFPDGIDVYFDLVGGSLLTEASARLAIGARVVLCGLMAEYNHPERAAGPPPGFWIRARATVTGLVVYDYEARRDEFIEAVLAHVTFGDLRQREDVAEGIGEAPAAFCRLMRGENFGKVVVRM